MRLLYVCSDWGIRPDGTKGASIHLRAITRALAERGHEVVLLSPRGSASGGHPAKALLAETCDLAEESAKLLRGWLADRRLSSGIEREVRPLIYNAWAHQRAIDALRQNPPDAVIERLCLFGHLGLDISQAFHIPLLLEVNAPLTREARDYRALQLEALAEEIETRVLRQADVIAPVSQELASQLIAGGVDPERMEVVVNGVNPEEFKQIRPRAAVRAELGIGDGFVVGFAGSLKPWHGVALLVEAFAQLASQDAFATLLLVGSGPTLGELRANIARLGLDHRVVFTGAVPHSEIPSLLSAMDVAVAPFLPSKDFYFSPIKVFEYMAAGVCVVASRIGQLTDVIEDGVDGLLCDPGDPVALLETIETARRSAPLRQSMAQRAKAKALSTYTWDRAAKQLEQRVESARLARACTETCGVHSPAIAAQGVRS